VSRVRAGGSQGNGVAHLLRRGRQRQAAQPLNAWDDLVSHHALRGRRVVPYDGFLPLIP